MRPLAVIIGPGGIGGAIINELGLDWDIWVVARRQASLDRWAKHPLVSACILTDASDWIAMDALGERLAGEAERPHIAIVGAVGSIILKPLQSMTEADWLETLHQNLTSAFCCVRLARHLRGSGAVLLFSSAAAGIGLPKHEAIAAAKGGVEALVRAAACSYAGKNIRVNALALGLVDTPLANFLTSREASRNISAQMHPLGRIGDPAQVARVATRLIEPESDWITGAVWAMDGGLSACASRA